MSSESLTKSYYQVLRPWSGKNCGRATLPPLLLGPSSTMWIFSISNWIISRKRVLYTCSHHLLARQTQGCQGKDMDLKSWEIENPSSPKLGPKSSKIELKMFKWAIFFFSVLWCLSTTFTDQSFSASVGVRVPCRALKLQKMDSPCNFVPGWLFLGTFKDFFFQLSQILRVKGKNK